MSVTSDQPGIVSNLSFRRTYVPADFFKSPLLNLVPPLRAVLVIFAFSWDLGEEKKIAITSDVAAILPFYSHGGQDERFAMIDSLGDALVGTVDRSKLYVAWSVSRHRSGDGFFVK